MNFGKARAGIKIIIIIKLVVTTKKRMRFIFFLDQIAMVS